ncbi:hypothetical protein BS50DRAFT_624664 [Corynespora cassiicola Philippines]|uniref:Uncharacterized protein n=1 Tax=Corynespora cassiicola Philippines TaxID=1448308 RepID=A0A2T2NBX4_CORCC|nr:hypothetical protein BS50DRAFT_624664 [Corynespora cassiicola Philippines]
MTMSGVPQSFQEMADRIKYEISDPAPEVKDQPQNMDVDATEYNSHFNGNLPFRPGSTFAASNNPVGSSNVTLQGSLGNNITPNTFGMDPNPMLGQNGDIPAGTALDGANDEYDEDVHPWLLQPNSLKHFRNLQTMALGNARILYGSDRNLFYEPILTHSIYLVLAQKDKNNWTATLVNTMEGVTTILRKVTRDEPLLAMAQIVTGLQKDCGKLFNLCGPSLTTKFVGPQGTHTSRGRFVVNAAPPKVEQTKNNDFLSFLNNAPRGPRRGRKNGEPTITRFRVEKVRRGGGLNYD